MKSQLTPYISFKGNAREAMEFYQSVFGGKLSMNTYEEFHAAEDPAEANNIMHAQLDVENGMTLMGADTPGSLPFDEGTRITVTLSGDNEPELRGYYDRLCAGGSVMMPLEKAPWGDTFGQVKDKYGVEWMVNISGQPG